MGKTANTRRYADSISHEARESIGEMAAERTELVGTRTPVKKFHEHAFGCGPR